MSTVRAKFVCNSVENYQYGKKAKLSAVYGKEGENHDFAKATPSGQLEIWIDNEVPASTFFEPGKSYYLTFEEAQQLAD